MYNIEIFRFLDLENQVINAKKLEEILKELQKNVAKMLQLNGLDKIVLPDLEGLETATAFGKRFNNMSAQKIYKILIDKKYLAKDEKGNYALLGEKGKRAGFITMSQIIKAKKENTKKIFVDCTYSVMLKKEFAKEFEEILKGVAENEEK